MKTAAQQIAAYVKRWDLLPDGDIFSTPAAHLAPVIFAGKKAMLKIAFTPEEQRGARLMQRWNGNAAAKIFRFTGEALLMERGDTQKSLVNMARAGRDAEATEIICTVIGRLHASPVVCSADDIGLGVWFSALDKAASAFGGLFSESRNAAERLLRSPRDVCVLHGDVHHRNILWGENSWFAIDPKALCGERGFDYANLFCNPDRATATDPEVFQRRLQQVSEQANVERSRLLEWILAWAGLSAAWARDDGGEDETALIIAEMAFSGLKS